MIPQEISLIYNQENTPSFLNEVPNPFLKNLLNLMVKAGDFAVKVREEQSDLGIRTKGVEDFVTEVDISNQNFLVTELLKVNYQEAFKLDSEPKVGFVLEEDTELTKQYAAKGDEDIFIYIDPIDGTTSFKDGENNFSVGVAVEDKTGAPLYSAVYLPARGEIYVLDYEADQPYIIKKNGIKEYINISETEPKLHKIAAHYNKEHKETLLKVYSALSGKEVKWPSDLQDGEEKFGENHVPGSLMMDLCDLATGKYDLLINGGAHLWDVAL